MLSLEVCKCSPKPAAWSLTANIPNLIRTTFYDGVRPDGFNPMRKEGAIVLGVGGDNTDGGEGEGLPATLIWLD